MPKKLLVALAAIVILSLALIGWGIKVNRDLATAKASVATTWEQIKASVQRQNDLIPNLIATSSKYAPYGEQQFATLTSDRARLIASTSPTETFVALPDFKNSLSRVLAITAATPELTADPNFTALTLELEDVAARLTNLVSTYNQAAGTYNLQINSFPTSIWAFLLGHRPWTLAPASTGAAS